MVSYGTNKNADMKRAVKDSLLGSEYDLLGSTAAKGTRKYKRARSPQRKFKIPN
jgi:hypothetical protein